VHSVVKMNVQKTFVTDKVSTMSTSNESTEGQTGESNEEPGAIPRKPEDVECQNREEKIADLLASGTNVYLSGGGGTGKSYCLKNVYLRLMERGLNVYKAGSTGVAAESIGGMTLHSWAGVQLGDKDAETYYITIQGRNRKAWLRWKQTSILIIDEISMTGGKFFQMLSDLGKRIRGRNLPFGGITLLICGDVCQLPPVKDSYFFQTDVYHDFNFSVIRLTHPWRFQKDIDFFYLLSRVRVGEQTPKDIQKLEERKVAYYKDIYNRKYKPGEIRPTRMFSKKIDVAEMNRKELDALPDDEYLYVCSDSLEKKTKTSTAVISHFQDLMNKNVPPEVAMKKNAQVMLTWNLDVERGLCNGSRGVVLECLDDCVLVKFKNGVEQFINPNVWTMETEDEIFTRAQLPLILAWCNTIHRCQSATLDCIVIDLGTSIFSDNMAYVALSRCRSLDGIYLVNLIPEKIKCDPAALEFERELIATEYKME
jgi:ATP-dependent DNA helicase PIF1